MEIMTLITRCLKIFHISRKPTNDEFWDVAKITSLGMVAIGAAGLIISFVMNLGV